jgi:hypothetical protein
LKKQRGHDLAAAQIRGNPFLYKLLKPANYFVVLLLLQVLRVDKMLGHIIYYFVSLRAKRENASKVKTT